MPNIPQLATYVSEDNNFTIEIKAVNASTGEIGAVYNAKFSPQGAFTDTSAPGNYAWVFSDQQGRDGVAPFDLRIVGSKRPAKSPYCIVDTWNGAYQADNSLFLQGSRSYVNSKGVVQVTALGTFKFSQARA